MDDKNEAERKIEELAASEEPVTNEEATKALNDYALALREEFEQKTNAEPENIELHTLEFFKANAHSAAAQIVHLANNAESESVRLAASKLVLQSGVKAQEAEKDPLKAILDGLKKNDNKPQPVTKED